MTSKGWAIIDRGKIDVATVSPTRRAAIINWLVVNKQVCALNSWTDDYVEVVWLNRRGKAECAQVTISAARTNTR